jgi:hypothetical protein
MVLTARIVLVIGVLAVTATLALADGAVPCTRHSRGPSTRSARIFCG